ncbi:MAG: hypothetical protein ACRDO1_15770 [Nocardioidaceae bacterium]
MTARPGRLRLVLAFVAGVLVPVGVVVAVPAESAPPVTAVPPDAVRSAPPPAEEQPTAGDQVVTSGCAIRLGQQPRLHANATHACTGFRSVRYNEQGWLVIKHDLSLPVISISVSPDETLVLRCIIAGGSGGGAATLIRFVNACTGKPVDARDPYLHGPLSNVWVTITSQRP